MERTQKEQVVEGLKQVFGEAGLVVVTQQSGLNVAEATDLRRKMRDAGARYKVTKNRLTRLALGGSPYAGLIDLFTGPTAIAYSADSVAAARVTVDFSKKNGKLIVIGGGMPGEPLDEAAIRHLASLPSLDELRAGIVGIISTPATRLVGLFQAPAGQLARLAAAYEGAPGAVPADDTPGAETADATEPAPAEDAADEASAEAPEIAEAAPEGGEES